MTNQKNWILNKTLVKDDLYKTLESGKLIDSSHPITMYSSLIKDKNKYKIAKSKLGLYLVNIRVFNTNKNEIYYSYKYLPYIFKESLILYLYGRVHMESWSEPGPYFPIIDTSLLDFPGIKPDYTTLYQRYSNISSLNTNISSLNTNIEYLQQISTEFKCIKEIFLFINHLHLCCNYTIMSELVKLGCNPLPDKFEIQNENKTKFEFICKNWLEFTAMVFKMVLLKDTTKDHWYKYISDIIKHEKPDIIKHEKPEKLEQYFYDMSKINFINSCLFLVEDINLFLDNIRKNGYPNINEGSQSRRGLVNDADDFLSDIETGYLDSLYNNYELYPPNRLLGGLGRSMFSKRNIHKISYSEV